MNDRSKTCCFFGHRKIEDAENLETKVYETVQDLILNHGVETFLFGSRSDFDRLCRKVVSKLKEKFPHIKRIYVRAEYPYISEDYKKYLLENFEETYFPQRAINAGKAVYSQRNREMIDRSEVCVIYYKENYQPCEKKRSNTDFKFYQPKSGTSLAYSYARQKNIEIINMV